MSSIYAPQYNRTSGQLYQWNVKPSVPPLDLLIQTDPEEQVLQPEEDKQFGSLVFDRLFQDGDLIITCNSFYSLSFYHGHTLTYFEIDLPPPAAFKWC
jgi:hypothetical protein